MWRHLSTVTYRGFRISVSWDAVTRLAKFCVEREEGNGHIVIRETVIAGAFNTERSAQLAAKRAAREYVESLLRKASPS
jgi:O-succinylbenzoate synthase